MITETKLVHKNIKNVKLTEEQILEIKNAKKMTQEEDKDCPAYSYDKLLQMLENTSGRTTPIESRRS
jgi:hypothetical protein